LRNGDVKVTIISPEGSHAFHGWFGEVMSGVMPMGRQIASLREICPQARILRGTAIRIDLAQQIVSVRLKDGEKVIEEPYDHLLLSQGTDDDLARVPGLAKYGWSLKEAGGLQAVRNHLLRMAEEVDATPESPDCDQRLSIVIAGGGFAGVEICAAIAELFQALRRFYPSLYTHKPRITLAHSGELLLPQLLPRFTGLVTYAKKHLERYEVDVRLDTRLVEVTEGGARLSDGDFVAASTVLSTLGQCVVPLPGTESLPSIEKGRLVTDSYLHVAGSPNLWTGGDVAHVIHPKTRQPCPANALWAIKQGVWIGDNIGLTVKGRPLRRFTYPGLGQAACMGIGKGILELYGISFTGWLAWFIRLGFLLYFMPSRRQAVRAALDVLMFPVLGRSLTLLDDGGTGPSWRASRSR
jgi:NADH dehydrogenase